MKSTLWTALSVGTGALAAIGTRKIVAAVWPGRHQPPLNPADRRIDWREAVMWAVASGIGAGLARVVAKRTAATGWERAFGETPPGLRAA